MADPGYDDGGILVSRIHLDPATMREVVQWSPEQARAYATAAELVRRWYERDG